MRNGPLGDVMKVWLYAAASVLLGAWISPLVYNSGKALAEISSGRQTNGPLRRLADVCREAKFPGFFAASLFLAAVILFLPFGEWFGGGRRQGGVAKLAPYVLPGDLLRRNPNGPRQAVVGFTVAVLAFLLAEGFALRGILGMEASGKFVLRALAVAVGWALLQEIWFRGIATGVFLKALRPAAALGMSAGLFALLHFLNPSPGINVADPDVAGAGFEMLGQIITQFINPQAFVTGFLPLLALGAALAYARWRTASLWLPTGLQAGWIFANTLSGPHTDSLIQGLTPVFSIILIGIFTAHLTHADAPETAP